jgi:hypothetical protein
VSDLSINTDRADHAPHIVDAVGKSVRVAVLPVKILTANGDSQDPVFAVSRDCIKQSLLFRFEVVGVFSPNSDEDLDASVLGSRDSVCESVAVGAGVEANGGDGPSAC